MRLYGNVLMNPLAKSLWTKQIKSTIQFSVKTLAPSIAREFRERERTLLLYFLQSLRRDCIRYALWMSATNLLCYTAAYRALFGKTSTTTVAGLSLHHRPMEP